jgi:hypothetical protein
MYARCMMTFFDWIRSIFKTEKDKPAPVEFNSVFRRYIAETDPDAPYYEERKLAAAFCDDALRLAKKRLGMSKGIQELESKISELKSASRLTDEESILLTQLLDRHLQLSNERSGLLEQLTTFDKSLYEMTQMEDDAHEASHTLQDAETYQRMLRQDIGHLHGEKSSLEHEQDVLVKAMNFVVKFSFCLVAVFVLATMILAYFAIVRGANVFLPSAGLFTMLASLAIVLYSFRRRAAYELKLNQKKQGKAVGLLNRKNTLFAYYTNYLKYCYGKYKVRSSKMLETNLSELDSYKRVVGRIDAVRNALRQSQEEIEDMLKAHGIKNERATLEAFAKHANFTRDRLARQELEKRRRDAEVSLSTLDARHEDLWLRITDLARKCPGREGVQPIIQTYLDEVDKLIESESAQKEIKRA